MQLQPSLSRVAEAKHTEGTQSLRDLEKRPLDPRLVAYCEQNVTVLINLATALRKQMGMTGRDWELRVYVASISRVALAWNPRYIGDASGPRKALAPWL